MPWRETDVMDERVWFVKAYRRGDVPMQELCRHAGISRKTGYKWLERYEAEGKAGLLDRSRAPHVQGRQVSDALERDILAMKRQYPAFGPKKVQAKLIELSPEVPWPAVSTIGSVLDRHGLVKRHKRRRKTPAYPYPLLPMNHPNAVWTRTSKASSARRTRACAIRRLLPMVVAGPICR